MVRKVVFDVPVVVEEKWDETSGISDGSACNKAASLIALSGVLVVCGGRLWRALLTTFSMVSVERLFKERCSLPFDFAECRESEDAFLF